MVASIDVHTHMLNRDWLELLRSHGKPRFELRKSLDAPEGIMMDGAPFMTPQPGHFDYPTRIKLMDEAKVDMAIVSLTCPNVYFGGPDISLKGAQIVNDSMAEAQKIYPSRIRWIASLPWEYPDLAVKELARSCDRGAVGVMVLANIGNKSLTDPLFAPVWQAIDQRALPVLVHPTAPPGTPEMDMRQFNLIASIGFMFDTSLAFARIFFDGFLDRYPNLKLIASHAGGTLPFLVGRLDQCFDNMNAARTKTSTRPSDYLRRIYYDAVTYRPEALRMAIEVGGADKVMYGSDYPHNIGDMVGCLKRVDDLPAGERDAVRGQNAERIFKL
ncbi:MAG: 2-amino-3-carboxymuconate-6-semialdehyde decarboxylase [Alphaproteobacteria bacterium]|nr:2-amino-3-carboxymuconate-6-semialdehyde decarboxylase [Alphaproteobacteria bacterium]